MKADSVITSMEHDKWTPFTSLSARYGVAPLTPFQLLQRPLPRYLHDALLEICHLFGRLWNYEDAYKLALEVITRVCAARYIGGSSWSYEGFSGHLGTRWSYEGFGGNPKIYDRMALEVATLEEAFKPGPGDGLPGIPRGRLDRFSELARRAWIWRFATLQDKRYADAELDMAWLWRSWEMKEVDMDIDVARKSSDHEAMDRNGRTVLVRYNSFDMEDETSKDSDDSNAVVEMDVDSSEQSESSSAQEEFHSLMREVMDGETAIHRLNRETQLKADEMIRALNVKRDRLQELREAMPEL